MRLAWDSAENESNRDKHGVSFDEAAELFRSGVDYLEIFDAAHSADEDVFRIVSARMATKNERRRYEEHEEANHRG